MMRLWCLLIGYAFGCIQSAYFIGKLKGIDIHQYGSGNAGTTNAVRVLGFRAGLATFLMDMFKCIIPAVIVTMTFGKMYPEMKYLFKVWTFAGCVLGHDYPFYLKFRGGKGVAVMAGFCACFHWVYIPVEILVFGIPYAATQYVSLGSLCVYAAGLVLMIIQGQLGVYAPATQGTLVEMYIVYGIMAAMCFWRHRTNIHRLVTGTERKTNLFAAKKDDVPKNN